ncbi:MAG TPA: DUF1499 domain-containing protein [Nitrospirales bacterium]|nr:DUF1499 domain-containing protein [Nitrospirales bacterium]
MTKIVFQETVVMFFLFMAAVAHGSTEGDLPVQNHRLAPCPDSPNCVSSLEDSEKHSIASYRYEKALAEAKAVLKQVFEELSRTELVQEEVISLHTKSEVSCFALLMMSKFCLMTPQGLFISGRHLGWATPILGLTGSEWRKFEICWRNGSSQVRAHGNNPQPLEGSRETTFSRHISVPACHNAQGEKSAHCLSKVEFPQGWDMVPLSGTVAFRISEQF